MSLLRRLFERISLKSFEAQMEDQGFKLGQEGELSYFLQPKFHESPDYKVLKVSNPEGLAFLLRDLVEDCNPSITDWNISDVYIKLGKPKKVKITSEDESYVRRYQVWIREFNRGKI
ncbi:MAG: hypothetical protein KKB21_02030 [Nanoarchaeota archaeon]|nr:hypothetical protein [Nanoarchaeota archaeon]MBU4086333.1 hypothetical protein [Nanoarchaeota archaeon]